MRGQPGERTVPRGRIGEDEGVDMLDYRRLMVGLVLVGALIAMPGCRTAAPVGRPVIPDSAAPAAAKPAAAPAAGYVIGPGDTLTILVFNHTDLTQKVLVPPSGEISFPFVGEVKAAGRTLGDLRQELEARLGKGYIPDPRVSVNVEDIAGQKIHVLGEVHQPRIIYAKDQADLSSVIAEAGGFTRDSNPSAVLLIRPKAGGGSDLLVYDLYAFLKAGDLGQNPTLMRGDVVYVPPSAIANVDRFFTHLHTILMPIRQDIMEGIILYPRVESALKGKPPAIQVE